MKDDEKELKDKIDALADEDWQPLLVLIPEIERTTTFGKMAGGGKDENGFIQMPYCVQAPIVSQFVKVAYDIPIVIKFDWSAWDEGREILGDETFDYDSIGLFAKCKLFTAILRNDRFCDGALVSAFESGVILKILKSMEKQVKAAGGCSGQ